MVLGLATWLADHLTSLGRGLGASVVHGVAALCGVRFCCLAGAETSTSVGRDLGVDVWSLVDLVEVWVEVRELDADEKGVEGM
jgi:hypothetical protein